jgi:hypothetical protein
MCYKGDLEGKRFPREEATKQQASGSYHGKSSLSLSLSLSLPLLLSLSLSLSLSF